MFDGRRMSKQSMAEMEISRSQEPQFAAFVGMALSRVNLSNGWSKLSSPLAGSEAGTGVAVQEIAWGKELTESAALAARPRSSWAASGEDRTG